MGEVSTVKEGSALKSAESTKGGLIKTKAARIVGSAAAGAALFLAADKEAKPASAALDPTPTTTPNAEALSTRITGTQTAIVADIDRLQKERQLGELAKTVTAIARQGNPGTPTPAGSGPDVVTMDRKAISDLIDRGVEVGVSSKLTAIASEAATRGTPAAKLTVTAASTATRTSLPTATSQPSAPEAPNPNESNEKTDGFPARMLVAVTSAAAAGLGLIGALKLIRKIRNRGNTTPPATPTTP